MKLNEHLQDLGEFLNGFGVHNLWYGTEPSSGKLQCLVERLHGVKVGAKTTQDQKSLLMEPT